MRYHMLTRSCFVFLLLLFSVHTASAAGKAGAAEHSGVPCSDTTITIHPQIRETIIRDVAVLPFQAENSPLAERMTQSFYSALDRLKKYNILPLDTVADWCLENIDYLRAVEDLPTAIRAGRALKVRGVLTGRIELQPSGILSGYSLSDTPAARYQVKLIDVQKEEVAWSIELICRKGGGDEGLSAREIETAMAGALDSLLDKLVHEAGDIYTPLLPQPKILATQGEIRKVRIIVRPDPPHVFSAYQLLGSDRPNGTFTPKTGPVPNGQSPVILEDDHLQDDRIYYYTILGISPSGLANIPAPPFPVRTTGQPAPVSKFYSAGKNVRFIQLFWEPSQDPNVNGYVIYRSEKQSGPFTEIAVINDRRQQSYTDYGEQKGFHRYGTLKDNSLYYYTIHTRNIVGVESEDSEIIAGMTKGAPEPPRGVGAIDRQPRKVPLYWEAVSDPDVKGYAIFRSRDQYKQFQQIDFVRGREQQEYIDKGTWDKPLRDDTLYYYRIRSVNVVDLQSEDSRTVSATTKAPPRPVAGITTESGLLRSITLHWQANPEEDIVAYEIFRGNSSDIVVERVGKVDKTELSFTDSGLADGRTYYYRLRAIDQDGLEGRLSEVVQATTKPLPVPPRGLQAEQRPEGIYLSWQANPEKDIREYSVYSIGFLATKIGSTGETGFLYTESLEPGRTYRFQVRAVDEDGLSSEFSDPVTVTIPKEEQK